MVAGKGTNGLTARGRAMRRVLTRWERSELTLVEFARRAGMRPGTLAGFALWRITAVDCGAFRPQEAHCC
jgi:hypothetical protein